MAIEKHINVIVSMTDNYSDQAEGFSMGLGGIAAMAMAAEAAILAMASAATAVPLTIGKSAFNTAVQYHDVLIDIEAVAESFGTTQAMIGPILDDLVKKFPTTYKKAGEVMLSAAQYGYGAADSLDAVSAAALRLSIATTTDVNSALEALMVTMNQFGLGLSDLTEISDVLAAAQFNSAMTVTEYREAIKYAGSMSDMAGWSFKEMAAALMMLRDRGLEASQTGTTLRMGIAKLFTETTKGTTALEKAGLAYADVNPEVHSLAEIFEVLEKAQMKAKDSTALFGIRASLLGAIMKDNGGKYQENLELLEGTTAAQDALNKMMGKFVVVLEMIEGDVDAFKKVLGTGLVEAIIKVIGKDEKSGLRGIILGLVAFEDGSGLLSKSLNDLLDTFIDMAKGSFEDLFGDTEGLYKTLVKIFHIMETGTAVWGIWMDEAINAFGKTASETEMFYDALELAVHMMALTGIQTALLHDAVALIWYDFRQGWASIEYVFIAFKLMMLELSIMALETADTITLGFFGSINDALVGAKERSLELLKEMAKASPWEVPEYSIWTDNVVRGWDRAHKKVHEMREGVGEYIVKVKEAAEATEKQAEVSNKVKDAITAWDQAMDNYIKTSSEAVVLAEEQKEVQTGVYEVIDATGKVTYKFRDAVKEVTTEAEKTKEQLSEIEKFEMTFELEQLKGDLSLAEEKVKATAGVIEKKLEWSAKLDITQLEESTKKMTAMFDSIDSSIKGTGETLASLFGAGDDDSYEQRQLRLEAIEQEIDLRKRSFDLQKALIELQIERGQAGEPLSEIMVSIEGNVEGWLKGLTNSLFNEIMIKAKAEAFSCMCM